MITYKTYTNDGGRECNEDSVCCVEKNGDYCFVVADGLGGHGYGEVASQIAIKTTNDAFVSTEPDEFIVKAFNDAQDSVIKMQREDYRYSDMKTTMVLLEIREEFARWAHIGDSRLYYFNKNKIVSRNDVGFTDIITDISKKPSHFFHYNLLEESLKKSFEIINDDPSENCKFLKDTYRKIEKAVGEQATIIVVGYPQLLSAACPFWSINEVDRVNQATDDFMQFMASAVAECKEEGMNIEFVSVQDNFSGHEAYSLKGKNYINRIEFTHNQDLLSVSQNFISAYSMHPNYVEGAYDTEKIDCGVEAYTKAVQKTLDKLEKERQKKIAKVKFEVSWDDINGAYSGGGCNYLDTLCIDDSSVSFYSNDYLESKICLSDGYLSDLKRINEYMYSTTIIEICDDLIDVDGTVLLSIDSTSHWNVSIGDEVFIYLAGTPKSELPEEVKIYVENEYNDQKLRENLIYIPTNSYSKVFEYEGEYLFED